MTSDSESRGPVLQIEVWNSYNGRRVQLRDETSIQTYDQLTQTIQDLTNIERKAQVLLRSDGSTFLNSKRRRNDDTKLYLFSLSPYDVQEQVSEVIHPTSIEQQDFISLNLFERNSIAVRLHEAADKRVQYMLQIHMEIGQQQAAIDAVINNLRSHVQDYSDKFEILHSKFQSLEMNIREYLKEVDIEQLKNTPVIPQLKRFLGCNTLIELVSKKPENVDSFIHTLQDTLTASNQEFTTRSMAIDEIKIDYESIDIDNKTNKVDNDPSLLLEELFENEKRQKRLVEILTQNAPSDASAQTSILQELIQLDASSSDISQKMYEVKERTTQLVHKVLASIKVAQRKIVKKIHFVVMERIVVELERLLIKLQSVANFKTNFNLSVLELERRRQWKMTLLTTVRAIFQEEYTKRRSFQQLVGNYVGGSMTKMLEEMPVISEDDLTITLDRSAPTATIDTQAIIAELGERQFAEIGLDPSVYDHLNADISSSLDSSLESSILGSGSKLSTFTNQIEALIAQQASLETKAYQLEVKNEELLHKQELEVQQLKINFAQQIQEKLETITKLKETVDALRAETIKQKQIIDKGDEQLERITQMQLEFAKLRTISSRMATVEAENFKLKQNVDSLTSENNHLRKLQAQTAEKQSQYDLEQMYNTMAELNRDLTKQLDESKYKLKEEQERNKKQQKMVANLFAENEKKLQQEVDNLQATISLITSENTTTQQELRLLHNSLNSQQTAMYSCIEKFQEMSSYLLLTHYYEELEKMKHTQEWDKLDLISQQIWNALATLLDKKNRS